MKKLTLILLALFMIVGCGGNGQEQIEPNEEPIQEEVVEEPTTYIVEFDELQTQLLDEINLADLVDYKQDNGNGTSKYEIPLDKKDTILHNLDMWLDADCLEIWADNEDWVKNVHHSKDYQLFKIYLSNASIDNQNAFSTLYAKRLFEFGLIFHKLNGEDNSWIFIVYCDSKGNKINQIDSDMLDL